MRDSISALATGKDTKAGVTVNIFYVTNDVALFIDHAPAQVAKYMVDHRGDKEKEKCIVAGSQNILFGHGVAGDSTDGYRGVDDLSTKAVSDAFDQRDVITGKPGWKMNGDVLRWDYKHEYKDGKRVILPGENGNGVRFPDDEAEPQYTFVGCYNSYYNRVLPKKQKMKGALNDTKAILFRDVFNKMYDLLKGIEEKIDGATAKNPVVINLYFGEHEKPIDEAKANRFFQWSPRPLPALPWSPEVKRCVR